MRSVFRRLRGESGVSAVIVMVSLIALLGASMLSIDAGSTWKTRRALITDSDAGALAAARYIDANGSQACLNALSAGEGSDAAGEARYVMTTNDETASLDGFEASPYLDDCSSDAGHVRVGGRMPVHLTFAPVFGIDDVRAYASSSAQYGPLATATGLRPIALCDKSPHFLEWAAHVNGDDATWGAGPGHPDYDGPVVHRIYFQRGSSGCGEASGNWDWLDFNEQAAPNGDVALRDWLREGYDGTISLGDDALGIAPDCNPEKSGSQPGCSPKTGGGGSSFDASLAYLRDSGLVFPIIVYDRVVDERDPLGCATPPPWTASGTNARYCPVAFLLLRLKGWDKITGQINDNSYFDFEFVDAWWVGQVGGNPSKGRPTTHGVQLCGGNYGTTVDERCDV